MTGKIAKSAHRLILLRHAKSAWPDNVADHDRPLAERGRKAAPLIGAYMEREKLIPDLALVSPARRARETWDIVRKDLPKTITERNAPGIYEVPAEAILEVIRAVEPDVRNLLLVGHNPGMEDLASLLAKAGEGDALERMGTKFSTGGLAVIDLDVDGWSAVSAGMGFLERFVTPRSIG